MTNQRLLAYALTFLLLNWDKAIADDLGMTEDDVRQAAVNMGLDLEE